MELGDQAMVVKLDNEADIGLVKNLKMNRKRKEMEERGEKFPSDDTSRSTGRESVGKLIVSESDISDDDADSSAPEEERKATWESRTVMLADLMKSPELCMKAVCVLYRQQTEEEKRMKETIYLNGRGFSQRDAARGSELAEFLLAGGNGDVGKTVKELADYDSEGPELCKRLAIIYNKQLFEIYKNKEDPFIGP